MAEKAKVALSQCVQCAEPSKYTCPKCAVKTCSLKCVKEHKDVLKCDGIRSDRTAFSTIRGYSSFTDDVSIQDQEFMHSVRSNLGKRSNSQAIEASNPKRIASLNSIVLTSDGEDRAMTPENEFDNTKTNNGFLIDSLPFPQRTLLSSAHRRRIWLSAKEANDCRESRYDKFSDTIFWTIKLKFLYRSKENCHAINEFASIYTSAENLSRAELCDLKVEDGEIQEIDDNIETKKVFKVDAKVGDTVDIIIDKNPILKCEEEIEEQEYTVQNIPDTLTVNTLIRQFVKPKNFGPVISKSDLDMDKMQKFIEAGATENGLMIYMNVPCCENERYYIVDTKQTLVDNFRNRYIEGYPTFLVVLSNQFEEFQVLNETEALQLHEARRNEFSNANSVNKNKFGGNRRGNIGNKFNQNRQLQNNFNGREKFYGNHQQGNFDHSGRKGYHSYNNERHNINSYQNQNSRNGINKQGVRNNFKNNSRSGCYNVWNGRRTNCYNDLDDVERFLEDPHFGQTSSNNSSKSQEQTNPSPN